MLTKFLATLSFIIFFLGAIAAADNAQPEPIDYASLPQMEITSDLGKDMLAYFTRKNLEVFGTAQDEFNHFLIWYNATRNNRSCVLGKPAQREYRIISPQQCLDLYTLGVANGNYKK